MYFCEFGVEREKEKDWRQSKKLKTNKRKNELKTKANKKQSVGTNQHECFKAVTSQKFQINKETISIIQILEPTKNLN